MSAAPTPLPSVALSPAAALRAVWRYRGLVRAITQRDLAGRHSGSLLGPLWLIVQPLVMILIYTLVFSQVMQARLPGETLPYAYSIYLCAGLLPWLLFTEIVQRGKNVFIEHASLIKQAAFPRLVLFLPIVVVALFNFAVAALCFSAFLWLAGAPLAGSFLWWPAVAVAAALGTGLALVLAVFNVFFRDVGQTVDAALQIVFWATPVVYPASILPDWARAMLAWNPFFGIAEFCQRAFLAPAELTWRGLAYPAAATLVAGLVAVLAYHRLYRELVDEL